MPSAAGPDGRLTFIGNATVLLEWGELRVLTDPNFIHRHEQVSVAPGVNTTRLHDPAIEIEDLPPIDLVVLSHFHGDHFDQVAERELRKDLPILTPPTAVDELEKRGFTAAQGLETWESSEVAAGDHRIRVTAVPGRHGPPVVDLVLPDVMGSIWDLESPAGSYRLYISGDTLVFDDLREIPKRYEGIDLGIFHLGGTRVGGILVTMDAEQGIEAVRIIGPQQLMPIHFDDYDLFTSPLEDFVGEVRRAGLEERLVQVARGETIVLEPRVTAAIG